MRTSKKIKAVVLETHLFQPHIAVWGTLFWSSSPLCFRILRRTQRICRDIVIWSPPHLAGCIFSESFSKPVRVSSSHLLDCVGGCWWPSRCFGRFGRIFFEGSWQFSSPCRIRNRARSSAEDPDSTSESSRSSSFVDSRLSLFFGPQRTFSLAVC